MGPLETGAAPGTATDRSGPWESTSHDGPIEPVSGVGSGTVSESDTRRRRKKKRRNGSLGRNKCVANDAVTDSTVSDSMGSPQLTALGSGTFSNTVADSDTNSLARPPKIRLNEESNIELESDDKESTATATPKFSPAMSPRRQTLLRNKKKNDTSAANEYISDLKGGLKSKPPDVSVHGELEMNKRVTLFKYASSKILVFDQNMNERNSSKNANSLGRLLGHGEFEIFQLHNGDVTYLSCGPSFVYPLLPKLKILRVSFNQFILPLVNPERYWKILINAEESNVIEVLEKTLERIVRYRNLYFGSSEPSEHGKVLDVISEHSPFKEDVLMDDSSHLKKDKHLEKRSSLPSQSGHEPNYYDLDVLPAELRKTATNEDSHSQGNSNSNFIWKNIPDSPPSPPMSPTQLMGTRELPAMNYDWNLDKKRSMNSLTSSIAGFNLGGDLRLNITDIDPKEESSINNRLNNNHLIAPKPKRLPQQNTPLYGEELSHIYQPHYQKSQLKNVDERSDESMDSLLDEYESNMTFTKSIAGSRPASRAGSIVLTPVVRNVPQFHIPSKFKPRSHNNNINYNDINNVHSTNIEETHHDNEIDVDDDFPTTSLSAYSKKINAHQALSARSRRSSRSELYSQENNWMEPSRIPKSRSNYTINSDYRALHRAIADRRKDAFHDTPDRAMLPLAGGNGNGMHKSVSMRSVRVNTADVYRMVHQRTTMEPSKGGINISSSSGNGNSSSGHSGHDTSTRTQNRGISRFFGW